MMQKQSERRIADVALWRFPKHARDIERLLAQDASFRDMCEELAEVEAHLSSLDGASEAVRASRRAECVEWIARLEKEIAQAVLRVDGRPRARNVGGG